MADEKETPQETPETALPRRLLPRLRLLKLRLLKLLLQRLPKLPLLKRLPRSAAAEVG